MTDDTLNANLKHRSEAITFTIREPRLLMIHTAYNSQQYPLEGTGIEVVQHPETTKVGIWHTDGITYQSLYLMPQEFKRVRDWFRGHGFPVPHIPVFTAEQIKRED